MQQLQNRNASDSFIFATMATHQSLVQFNINESVMGFG
jgi:hypothetical protein